MTKKKVYQPIHVPRVPFDRIKHTWIRYGGRAYNAATCHPDIFHSAVKEYCLDGIPDTLDLEARWFLLCYTAIPVYTSAYLDNKDSQ